MLRMNLGRENHRDFVLKFVLPIMLWLLAILAWSTFTFALIVLALPLTYHRGGIALAMSVIVQKLDTTRDEVLQIEKLQKFYTCRPYTQNA